MTIKRRRCKECGGNNPETCDLCWAYLMDRDEAARDREADKRIDEARGK